MFDHDDELQDERLDAGRGLFLGAVIGFFLWTLIINGIMWAMRYLA